MVVAENVRGRRWSLVVTYAAIVAENVFELLYPFATGLAVDGLLDGAWSGVAVFVGIWVSHTSVGVLRQLFDTRSFNTLHVDMATALVTRQRARGAPTSTVVARTTLVGEYVDFLERDVATAITAGFAVIGSLVMLAFYDPLLGLVALGLAVPVTAVNSWLIRRSARLHRAINDESEHQVAIIERAEPDDVRRHFRALARHTNRLSDTEATSWGIVEVFAIGFSVFVLWRTVGRTTEVGTIFATIAYAWAYLGGFDEIPAVLQRLSSLRDIRRRLDASIDDDGDPGGAAASRL